jgi:glycosyltransferase involved in cell wall biosynthesis
MRDVDESLISVIMPCYNSQRWLAEAVSSVFSQRDVDVELVLVDDGSTDESLRIARELEQRHSPRMRVLEQRNQGPFPARNLALQHARGEWIAFLDADDYWDPGCLSKLREALCSSDADLAYCGWQNVGDGAPGGQPHIPDRYEQENVVARFLKGCPWPIHGVLVRRRVVDAVGGFSERYRTAMDYDIWLRMAVVTQKFVLVPEVLAFYRWHDGGQISSVRWEQVLDSWNVRRDFLRNNPSVVAHVSEAERREKVDGFLLSAAYSAYWKRDLISAQRLFRRSLRTGYWRARDLKYLVPSILPGRLYRGLIALSDRNR